MIASPPGILQSARIRRRRFLQVGEVGWSGELYGSDRGGGLGWRRLHGSAAFPDLGWTRSWFFQLL